MEYWRIWTPTEVIWYTIWLSCVGYGKSIMARFSCFLGGTRNIELYVISVNLKMFQIEKKKTHHIGL